ncbi:PREDICTED: aprataxin and PNK-like factor [Tinamus guttatus]|uniref:aprataxin and PNK-like factor n=1 Tax=Tinamus guttatus TaxID=94827 RepID=UPI00052EA39D|nr:PREDICTED: aprataxin and PNK-like factor [Tinamus guttatus]
MRRLQLPPRGRGAARHAGTCIPSVGEGGSLGGAAATPRDYNFQEGGLPTADGGCPVPLPSGESVLGRGPLLGITDKRVSRKHAIMEVEGGQVRIKPIHVNPCFYQSSENGQLLPLEAHEWHSLKFGDSFSLLVDKYIFKVLSAHTAESTISKSQETNAEETPSIHPIKMSCSPSLIEPSCSSSVMQENTKIRKNKITSRHLVSVLLPDDHAQLKSVQRKRVLPSWMLEEDLMVQRLSDPVIKEGGEMKRDQGEGRSDIESLKTEINVEKRKRLTSEEITEICKEEQYEGKKGCLSITVPSSQSTSEFPLERTTRNMERNDKTDTKKHGISVEKNDRQQHYNRCKTTNRIEKMEKKEQITGSTSQQARWGRTSLCYGAEEGTHESDANWECKPETSGSARSLNASERSKQMKHKRTPCMYGRACYRKNPVHFEQFSHPNDDDYHEIDIITQHNSDDRPECPYGSTCYRKNPQHKLEYKHSAPPGKSSCSVHFEVMGGRKRALEEDSDSDGELNKYDLNDSFIDDDEECASTDEDSDWEPNPEEKDSEDVETLLKEAHRFVNAKK